MNTKRSGFTLIELMVYCVILLGFLYVFTGLFTSVLDVQLESQTASAVVQDSGYILARLKYDIGRATSLVTPESLGAQSTSLVLDIGGTQHSYTLAGGDLLVTNADGTNALNSFGTNVSNLTFRRYGNVNGKNSVSVAFTLTTTTARKSGAETRGYQATIGLR